MLSICGSRSQKPIIYPTIPCENLILYDLTQIPNAPSRIKSSRIQIDPFSGKYACFVQGYISGQISFTLALPSETFTGRYAQLGVGSFAGYNIPILICGLNSPYFMNGTVAYSQNDAGHVSLFPQDGLWANNQLSLRTDYAYQSEVLMKAVAMRIINIYYAVNTTYDYFISCSNGGRQGNLLMQRFPELFDGYSTSGSVLYPSALGLRNAWTYVINQENGSRILTTDKIPALSAAVMAACDGLDGLIDNEITDPDACFFDPVEIQCPSGVDNLSCLTPEQVKVVRQLYVGARDPISNTLLYPGGCTRGSESLWSIHITTQRPIVQAELGLTGIAASGLNYLRYLGTIIPNPHLNIDDIDFSTQTLEELGTMNLLYHGSSLNIDKFIQGNKKGLTAIL